MEFQPSDVVELVRVLAWPVFALFFLFLYGESIRDFLSQIIRSPLKNITTPLGSAEFYEKKLEQELKSTTAEYGDDEAIRLDADSIKEYDQKVQRDELKLQVIKLEFRLLYFEQMIDWILTNNNAFVKNLTREAMDEFEHKASETLKAKYPEYFD